jgi:hypothetical protein
MAAPTTTVEIKPSTELLAALDETNSKLDQAAKPFDFDTVHPFVLQSATLISEYYYALVEKKVPAQLIDNLVYDFHRVLWSMPLSAED